MQYSFAITGAALVATVAAGEYAAPASTTCTTTATAAPVYSAPVYSAPVSTFTTSASPVAPVYTTAVVTSYETYCPYATTIVHGAKTFTATSATTLTITDCPCTITKSVAPTSAPYVAPVSSAPVYSSAVSSAVVTSAVAPVTSSAAAVSMISDHQVQAPTVAPASSAAPVYTAAPAAPVYTAPVAVSPVYSNSTGSASPSGTVSSKPATYTGAASKAFTASGAGLAAVFGLVAYIL